MLFDNIILQVEEYNILQVWTETESGTTKKENEGKTQRIHPV